MENKLKINVLENTVKIMQINKNEKHFVFEPLSRCLLENKNVFYSITESDDELSFIVDQHLEYYFRNINCTRYDNSYKIIQLYESDTGINHVGIVSYISSLFSDLGISILYINTFNNNFILVKEEDLKQSINALNSIL